MWETRSVFHISMPLLLGQDCLRCRWPVAQRRMRPHRVVLHSPLFDHHLRLLQGVEDLSVQALISQLAVEALTVPVLPGTARFVVLQVSNADKFVAERLWCVLRLPNRKGCR